MPERKEPLRIYLVEDHHIMRRGLASLLSTRADIEIVGEAGQAEDALAWLAEHEAPDVVVMDVSLPGMNGIDATRAVKAAAPAVSVLILSMYDNPILVHQAVLAGASGYILKKAMVEELTAGLAAVMDGEQYLSPQIEVGEGMTLEEMLPTFSELTRREQEVMEKLSQGVSVKDIAEEMVISVYTVYTHINNIKQKMGIDRTTDLVRYALENPMILSGERD